MKKLILVSAIAMSGLMYQTANAQIGIHLNVNLGLRPVVVAPVPVVQAGYYYLPDVEAYYSVSEHCYYYQDGGSWISAAYLPGSYHNYDWQHARHFAVNEARPYLHNDVYRARYGGVVGHRDWNYRDEHNARVYADRDRFDHSRDNQHNNNRSHNDNRNDDHGNRGNDNNRGRS
jgi:hypothetical protein